MKRAIIVLLFIAAVGTLARKKAPSRSSVSWADCSLKSFSPEVTRRTFGHNFRFIHHHQAIAKTLGSSVRMKPSTLT